jgi:hypothetical protein
VWDSHHPHWHPEIEEPEVALPQHLDLLTKWLEEIQ